MNTIGIKQVMSETMFIILTVIDGKNKYWSGDYWVSYLKEAKFYKTEQSAQKTANLLSRKVAIKQISVTLPCNEKFSWLLPQVGERKDV